MGKGKGKPIDPVCPIQQDNFIRNYIKRQVVVLIFLQHEKISQRLPRGAGIEVLNC
jgi:hypothetical protein